MTRRAFTVARSASMRGFAEAAPCVPSAYSMPVSTCARKSGSDHASSVWPPAVYHARPPSYSCHHAIGWSVPIPPPSYVDSSIVASTCTDARGFDRKLYHSSVRVHLAGNPLRGSATSRVADWTAG